MKKTLFHIAAMDCPSEERMIRMKLDSLPFIHHIETDFSQKILTILHDGKPDEIEKSIHELNLGATLIESIDHTGTYLDENIKQSRVLKAVLFINLGFFITEMISGLLSRSMGLVADSLDMLADTLVYGMSLWVVGSTVRKKKRVALLSGYLQLILAFAGLTEVIRRFIIPDQPPESWTMVIISILALAGNSICLVLLSKTGSKEAHIRASMIFTSNDVIVNMGVIAAGFLVYFTGSALPDLLTGMIVFILVIRGALRILKLG